ncbi:hypothetical protein GWI34_05185 [Actinomadura sp. DSM 109109]|nr:hypothetical protein [Actinomadura lepetitiana]
MSGAVPGSPPERPGREFLSLPSPGRARYLTLICVLVLAGAYAGRSISDQREAAAREACVTEVRERAVLFPDGLVACLAPSVHEQLLAEVIGALAVLPPGLLLMWLLPLRLTRRAGPLTDAPDGWQERAAEFAGRAARRRIVVRIGRLGLREPFTVPTPRGCQIVLPRGVPALPPAQGAAVLRHEAAHAAAGDVTLVWLTRGVWWTLPAVLLAPVLFRIRHAGTSPASIVDLLARPAWAEYGLRAAALLALTALLSAAVLRSREHEADLRSAAADAEALAAVLRGGAGPAPRGWRRASARHPSVARRLRALTDPPGILGVATLETVALGAVVAMVVTAVWTIVMTGPTPPRWDLPALLAGLLGGVLLAFGWAAAVWRTVITRQDASVRGPQLGLAAGTVPGMVGGVWSNGMGIAPPPGWPSLLLVPLLAANAGAASTALARLWARRDPAADRRFAWVPVHLANVVLFAGALWIAQGISMMAWADLAFALELGGQAGPWATPAAVALAAVATAAWAWTRAGGPAAPVPLRLLAGIVLVAGGCAAVLRWATARPSEAGRPLYALELDLAAAVGAGLCCLAILLLISGRDGLGPSLAAAPAATAATAGALWALDLPDWEDPVAAAAEYAVRPLAQLALCLLIAVLLAALLPPGARGRRLAPRTALAVTALLSISAVLVLHRLAPRPADHGPASARPLSSRTLPVAVDGPSRAGSERTGSERTGYRAPFARRS